MDLSMFVNQRLRRARSGAEGQWLSAAEVTESYIPQLLTLIKAAASARAHRHLRQRWSGVSNSRWASSRGWPTFSERQR